MRVRIGSREDIPEMHRIRAAVRENRLGDPAMVQPHAYRAMSWLFASGVDLVWLNADPGTGAERFSAAAGWHRSGPASRSLSSAVLRAGNGPSPGAAGPPSGGEPEARRSAA